MKGGEDVTDAAYTFHFRLCECVPLTATGRVDFIQSTYIGFDGVIVLGKWVNRKGNEETE